MATAASSNAGLTVVAAGSFVHLLSGEGVIRASIDVFPISSAVPFSTNADGTEKKEQIKFHDNFHVLATTFSNDGASVAVGTSAKTVVIFTVQADSLVERRTFRIPKTPTALAFDRADAAIVVADRAGVVRKYAVEAAAKENKQQLDEDDEDERDFEGDFVCSAISMMLDVRFSGCGKYLLVTDRDEKMRVHRYPQTFVLHSLGLGHKDYVNSAATARVGEGEVVFTAGGDGSVIVWDYESEEEKGRVEGLGAVRRLRVVKEEVRKNGASTLLLALLNNSCTLVVLRTERASDGGVRLTEEKRIATVGRVMDVAVVEGGERALVVSSTGVFSVPLSGKGPMLTASLGEDHLATLAHLKDPIPDMTKKVAHDNMADYLQRKEKKIAEHRNKKRKNGNESISEPPTKKCEQEDAEVTVVE